jgi:hypothetical protein
MRSPEKERCATDIQSASGLSLFLWEISDNSQEPVCVRLSNRSSVIIAAVRKSRIDADLLELTSLLLDFGFSLQALEDLRRKSNLLPPRGI